MQMIYDERSDKPWRVLDRYGRQAYMRHGGEPDAFRAMKPIAGKTEGEVLQMLFEYVERMVDALTEIENAMKDALLSDCGNCARLTMKRSARVATAAKDGLYLGRESERRDNDK